MASGNLSLLRRELDAGTAFIVQQNTRWSGTYLAWLPGRRIGGGVIGLGGRMVLFSSKFTG